LNQLHLQIAYVYPEILPSDKARGVSIIKTIAELSKLSQITFFCEYGTDKAACELQYDVDLSDVHFVYISKKLLGIKSNYFFNLRLTGILKKLKNIVVYTRHLKVAKHLIGTKSIFFECHEIFSDTITEQKNISRKKIDSLKKLEQYVYSNANGLVFSNARVQLYCNQFFKNITKYQVVIYNGSIVPQNMPIKDFSAIDGVYYIGSLLEWKGVDGLITVFASIPNVKLYIIGNGQRLDALMQLCKDKGFNNIVFLGFKSQKKISTILSNKSRICIIPNSISVQNKYSVPIKLFEYIATSNVVIAPDMATISEIDPNGNFIKFFKYGDLSSMREVVSTVISADADMLLKSSLLGFDIAKKFTWHKKAESIINFLNEHRC